MAIDEAVTLAKRYASEEAGRLVNGILGAIAREAGRVSAADEALERAEELLARLEQTRERLEATQDPDAGDRPARGARASSRRQIDAEIERRAARTPMQHA